MMVMMLVVVVLLRLLWWISEVAVTKISLPTENSKDRCLQGPPGRKPLGCSVILL